MAEEIKKHGLGFEFKKILLDKIVLLVVTIILALLTIHYFEKEKQAMAYEHALALKYTDFQLETYQLANEFAFLNYLMLHQYITIDNDKTIKFSEQMKSIEETIEELNEVLNKFEKSVIKNSVFLTKYSIEEIYFPLTIKHNEIAKEFKKHERDFDGTLNTAKNYIELIHSFQNKLKQTNKIFKKINPDETITKVQLVKHPLFKDFRNRY